MSETSSRLIIVRDGMALMSRGDSGSVKFVGGRLLPGEDPLTGAIREGREETGVDLTSQAESIFSLPFQRTNSNRPSYWYGLVLDSLANFEPIPADDVVALFWVELNLVESKLTHDTWKEHWINCLLPGLLAQGID